MKRSLVNLLVVFAVSAGFFARLNADEVKLDNILRNLEKNDQTMVSVKFNYTQEISYSLTNEVQRNSGEMIFAKPNDIYFRQNNPLEQIIVSNGKKVWIYTPSYKQVIVDVWSRWINSGILPNSTLSLNLNWTEMKSKYSFEYIGLDEGSYLLLLSPLKTKNSGTSGDGDNWKLKIWIDPTDFKPVRTDLIGENIKVMTRISEYTRNAQSDKSIFNFKVPDGVEVMNMK